MKPNGELDQQDGGMKPNGELDQQDRGLDQQDRGLDTVLIDPPGDQSWRKKPSNSWWMATGLLVIDGVWCVVVTSLTATGLLLGHQSIECQDFIEFVPRVQNQANQVYLWTSFSLLACVIMLLQLWRRRGCYFIVALALRLVVLIVMTGSWLHLLRKEDEEVKAFKERYLVRMLDNDKLVKSRSDCDIITNLYRWQTEFKCCGFERYQDWNVSIPTSCLCDGEDNVSGCVELGQNSIYEKPCLPAVLSLVDQRGFLLWIVRIIWVAITSLPLAVVIVPYVICAFPFLCWVSYDGCQNNLVEHNCAFWKEKTVPVVFIRKNNNQTQEKEEWIDKDGSQDDHVLVDLGEDLTKEGEAAVNDSPVRMIPLSLLSTLQRELDPPPAQHRVTNEKCMCIFPPPPKTKKFYTVLIEEGSPLLPSDAVVVDANKPTNHCGWDQGHYWFDCRNIVWPNTKLPQPTVFGPHEQIPDDGERSSRPPPDGRELTTHSGL